MSRMTILQTTFHNFDCDDNEMYYLSSDDTRWLDACTNVWKSFCNECDAKSLKMNSRGQLPLCNVYKDSIAMASYITAEELCGVSPEGSIMFGDMHPVKKSLIWSCCTLDHITRLFNRELKKYGFELNVTNAQ
jgi:hypothetical protein